MSVASNVSSSDFYEFTNKNRIENYTLR